MTTRRDAIRALAGIAALPLVEKLSATELGEVWRRANTLGEPRALSAAEYQIVVHAAERIIPRTATPGATDARVADFIDVMLADWYDAPDRARFTTGLATLDDSAIRLTGRKFVLAQERQQVQLLETLDRELSGRRQAREAGTDDHWFAVLKHLTIWGYYTSRPGIVDELRVQLVPGRYDGNARY
jgi:hypothetical protein